MFSEKAKKNFENCRFCWMCRYICPVGLQTGSELNNARAKALLISYAVRGQKFDESFAEAMYQCCLCAACSQDCATGFEPPVYIREARTEAVVNDVVPPNVQNVITSVLDNDNIFGVKAEEASNRLKSLLPDAREKAEVLIYVGHSALCRAPEIAKAFIALCGKAGIDFTILHDEGQSGAELGDLIGYVEETVDKAKMVAEKINATGAKKVVPLDPNCTRVMRQEYPAWECGLKPEVQTATAFMAELIREGKLRPGKIETGLTTFHDPCKLSRDLDEVNEAREILSAMGIHITEMLLNRKWTKCCGTEILKAHSPNITELTAGGRWDDARRLGIRTMVTACPGCYDVLGEHTPEGLEVKDIFMLLAEACRC